jgi:hypothetical protein
MFDCPSCSRIFPNRQAVGSHRVHCTSLFSIGLIEHEENALFDEAWDIIQGSARNDEEHVDPDDDSQMRGSEFGSSIGDDDERYDDSGYDSFDISGNCMYEDGDSCDGHDSYHSGDSDSSSSEIDDEMPVLPGESKYYRGQEELYQTSYSLDALHDSRDIESFLNKLPTYSDKEVVMSKLLRFKRGTPTGGFHRLTSAGVLL